MDEIFKSCRSCVFHETYWDEIDGEMFDDGCVCNNDEGEKYHFDNCDEYNKPPFKGCPFWADKE